MEERNYAFIDGQNVYHNTSKQGWRVDYVKLQSYLKEKYNVEKIFIFLGYMEDNFKFYHFLEKNDYIVIFKEVSQTKNGEVKGNCDAELIFTVCLHFWAFDKAVIISGDGDYYSLSKILNDLGKLRNIMAPDINAFSSKYWRLGQNKLEHMNRIRHLISI